MKKRIRTYLYLLLMLAAAALPCAGVQAKNIVIVLDPGHGGSETGATRTWSGVTYREELLNLKIAKYAKAELEKYAGVDVYLTRSTDHIAPMDRETRINIAKSKNATALVSIHLNSTSKKKQRKESGSYAYVPSVKKYSNKKAYAKEARELGTTILKQLNSYAGTRNNGLMNDDELGIILYGMRAKMPSMIIEHCFVNNPDDCKQFLSSNTQLKRLGVADATGIAQYYGLKKKSDAKTGWQTAGGKTYYYQNGVKVKKTWKKIGGKYYYFNSKGVLQTGVFTIGKSMYLSNASGVRQKGLVTYKGRKYYANSKGKLYTGWRTYKGKKYYFSPQNGKACIGLHKIGKDKYYFDKNGVMKKKWITVSKGRRLYFSTVDGKMLKNRWLRSDGNWYYLGKDGKPYAGGTKVINGVSYRFNAKGICKNYR